MVTLEDVAKMTQVSTMTVSRVINRQGTVSEETRQRVLSAVEKLNYRPNLVARGLATRKTNSIGVLVSRLENPVYAVMVSGINTYASEYGMDILLSSGLDEQRLINGVNTLFSKQIDGLIVLPVEIFINDSEGRRYNLEAMHSFNQKFIAMIDKGGVESIPIIMVGNYLEHDAYTDVREDYKAGACMAVEYLFNKGHRKIGIVSHYVQDKGIWGERYAGYLEGMKKVGCPIEEKFKASCMDTVDDAYEAGRQFATRGDLPTALYCANDIIAVGVMNALKDSGLRIPEDISVIGHDGSLYSEIVTPRLTTVSIRPFEIGCVCMEQVYARMNGKDSQKLTVIQPEVVEGKSVLNR